MSEIEIGFKINNEIFYVSSPITETDHIFKITSKHLIFSICMKFSIDPINHCR